MAVLIIIHCGHVCVWEEGQPCGCTDHHTLWACVCVCGRRGNHVAVLIIIHCVRATDLLFMFIFKIRPSRLHVNRIASDFLMNFSLLH